MNYEQTRIAAQLVANQTGKTQVMALDYDHLDRLCWRFTEYKNQPWIDGGNEIIHPQ